MIVHHTGGANDLNTVVVGRPDLAGPLANLYSDRDPPHTITLISGGRCNHAGAGAQVVLDDVRRDVAPTGPAVARGLLDGPTGNGYFHGIEAENLGNGQPWPAQQLETIAAVCAALCRHHGWTSNRVIGHLEWTRRKPDPFGFSMASMRLRVAAILSRPPQGDEEMTDAERTQLALAAQKATDAVNYAVDAQKRLEDLARVVVAIAAKVGA